MKFNKFFSGSNSGHCYIIAEAGLNHNGSIEIAKKLIDVAAIAGADAVKFQKRTVDVLAVKSVLDAPDDRFPEFGKTYREIREHLEFNFEQYRELKKYSELKGLDFIVTAFDTDAVDFLEDLGVEIYKLASHSLTNIELLEYLAKLKKKTILSTGMSDIKEIDTAVEIFQNNNAQLMLLHCVSAYPTPLDECNLQMIKVLEERYRLPVGYSGHELGYLPSVIAAAMGAKAIERHYTIDKNMIGFDHKMSLGSDEFIAMVRDIRSVLKIKGNGDKFVSKTEMITRDKYHVSMVSKKEIKAGTILDKSMICYRNPGTGIHAKNSHKILGKKAVKDLPEDILLTNEMFK
ncbi:N-acetylneuraminate synthase family protein [Desulfatiferula olefinivorans]